MPELETIPLMVVFSLNEYEKIFLLNNSSEVSVVELSWLAKIGEVSVIVALDFHQTSPCPLR